MPLWLTGSTSCAAPIAARNSGRVYTEPLGLDHCQGAAIAVGKHVVRARAVGQPILVANAGAVAAIPADVLKQRVNNDARECFVSFLNNVRFSTSLARLYGSAGAQAQTLLFTKTKQEIGAFALATFQAVQFLE